MGKQVTTKCGWTLGEVSPRLFGRFEKGKPIFAQGAAILENFLVTQNGAIMFWPGTRYIVAAKYPYQKCRLERFAYSTSQEYVIEMGNLYFRFLSIVAGVPGQLVSGGVPVEVVSPFVISDIPQIELVNKSDVMYFTHPSYYPQKLVRTSSTSFTLSDVPFVRGPFLDGNITATTITPSAATGTGITLTASTSIFKAGHVGSLWRVNSGASTGAVVKITTYTSGTVVTGDVQAEPDGTSGNIGGTGAYTNWAEGAFSAVQGYPTSVTFFEGRLVYGMGQKIYASVVGAYDNFNVGTATDSDAYIYGINSNIGASILWLDVDSNLKIGTSGGTITAVSPAGTGITPSNPPQIITDTDYAAYQIQPEHIGGYLYFLQSNAFQVRQLVYDLVISRDKSEDMTLLADHILRDGDGGTEIARQQSPNDRLWIPRNDGQGAVFTRNVEQGVQGWCRRVAGSTAMGPGLFESFCVLPKDGGDDIVFASVQRNINGSVVRYLEFFTPEMVKNDWDHIRVDCSLSLNNPVMITNIANDTVGTVTALAHGFTSGDVVKIDNVAGMTELNFQHYLITVLSADTFSLSTTEGTPVDTTAFGKYYRGGEARKMVTTLTGLDHLEGETVSVQTDTGLPAAQQTFLVSGGSITLPNAAAVIHVGLPYDGTLQFLPLGEAETQGRSRKVYISLLRVFKSSGGSFGKDVDNLTPIVYPNQTPNVNPPPQSVLYTGDVEVDFESFYAKDWQPVIYQDKPLPLMILAAVLTEDMEMDK